MTTDFILACLRKQNKFREILGIGKFQVRDTVQCPPTRASACAHWDTFNDETSEQRVNKSNILEIWTEFESQSKLPTAVEVAPEEDLLGPDPTLDV